jgi:sugar phosphate isomerase/epimerase
MNFIRLKANLRANNLEDRLQYNPEIIEFFLSDTDLLQPDLIREQVRKVKGLGIQAYLHHPPKYNGRFLDILSEDPEIAAFYRHSSELLAQICREEDIYCVVHAHYSDTESSQKLTVEGTRAMRRAVEQITAFAGGRFLWEDTIEGLFSHANPYLMKELIIPLELPLTVDVSHTFIAFKGNNGKLEEVLAATRPYARYYHLVDSMGLEHDSLSLGLGRIDWAMVKPYVEDRNFIFEIGLKGDHSDCTPMVESAAYFRSIKPNQ